MGCGSKNKSCNQKSCQRYYNNKAQAFTAAGSVQLDIAGSRVVDTGVSIETNPQSYEIVKPGLYHISADAVVNATTAGDIDFSVFMDGVELPCTFKVATLAAGYTPVHTETDLVINGCCGVNRSITFVVKSVSVAVGSVTQFCSGITKLA